MKHKFQLRVYYEDTDTMGIVYYANYLRFAERARTELLRELGIEKSGETTILNPEEGHGNLYFVVRSCDVRYLRPARHDDWLRIETELIDREKMIRLQKKINGSAICMLQNIFRDDDLLVRLRVNLVSVDSNHMPCILPKKLLEAFGYSNF